MLGEGLRAGLSHMGIAHRTVCYLEREAYAAAVLAARMEEGSLDAAPIWPDLLTFNGAAWHGSVDCIAAGFPCQDLSLAGRRAGLDGSRSGLFFNIVDIADACGARYLFLENVAGIASATASVVDEAEGALEERAAARVLGELADRGWHAEWLTLSASDVGASHGRARWFCWAWRMGNTGLQHQHLQQREDGSEHSGAGRNVANAEGQRGRERQRTEWKGRAQAEGASDPMAHPTSGYRGQQPWPDQWGLSQPDGGASQDAAMGNADQQRTHRSGPPGQQAGGIEPAESSECLADPTGHGRHQGWPESGGEQGRPDASECSESMECEFCGYVYPAGLGLYGCPDCLGEGFDDVANAGCSHARRIEHIAGASWVAPEYQSGSGAVAHTSSPRQQGTELGRACDGNGGGAGNTWTN